MRAAAGGGLTGGERTWRGVVNDSNIAYKVVGVVSHISSCISCMSHCISYMMALYLIVLHYPIYVIVHQHRHSGMCIIYPCHSKATRRRDATLLFSSFPNRKTYQSGLYDGTLRLKTCHMLTQTALLIRRCLLTHSLTHSR